MKPRILVGLACALVSTLFGLSVYSGFSAKADVFCTGGRKTSKLAIGSDGLVVLWHRVLSLSLVAEFGLLLVLTLIAHSTYTREKYEAFIEGKNAEEANNHLTPLTDVSNPYAYQPPLRSAKDDMTGNEFWDAFLIFETWKLNIFHLTSLLYIAFYAGWIIFGLFIMRSFVPRECFDDHMGDKTVLTIMELIVFLSIAPFVSSLYLLVLTRST
jgi:hypothetical protein